MPFDGTAIANIKYEILSNAQNSRIDKIYQTENDEIVLSLRGYGKALKLLMTASSSHPRIHFTTASKENPQTPPMFCMVLRKHLNNGKLLDVLQPGFERILVLCIEAMNEMGDFATKKLIIEIMGKHSNIILIDENDRIIDSIKHVSYDKSSVRQVLPGKAYAYPPSQNKINPLDLNTENFRETCLKMNTKKLQELVYQSYTGISPLLASEICHRAGLNPADVVGQTSQEDLEKLNQSFKALVGDINNNNYTPEIVYEDTGKPKDFSSFPLSMFVHNEKQYFASLSTLLEAFYQEKDALVRTAQKTQDLRKLVQNHIERLSRKKDIQLNTLKEIENRDELKVYGELLTANVYAIEKGTTSFTTVNYYDENSSEITIPLDATLTPVENAQRYFRQYNKAKRTYTALTEQIKQNEDELYYLESLMTSLSGTLDEAEIAEIRQELFEQGFIKRAPTTKGKGKVQKQKASKPLCYLSTDGFAIYVGKNNKQNDDLTLNFAAAGDIWLHAKNMPGSHVIIRTEGREIPDSTIEEAANLAAYFSKGRESSLVPIDYTPKKYVKKPNGAKPGMVIYETNKTAYITPDESMITKLKTPEK